MKIPQIRVSLAFCGSPDNTLVTFCRNVLALIFAAGLTNVPISAADLTVLITDFSESKAAQPNGGKAATADKDNKRAALLTAMRELALFVQVASNNNVAILLSTGFQPMSLSRARYPLSKPVILRVVPGMTGTALVTMSREKVARGCEIRVALIGEDGAPGEFNTPLFSTSARNVPVPNLTPGALYALQGRTVGGSTTYSDWSDLIVQRAA